MGVVVLVGVAKAKGGSSVAGRAGVGCGVGGVFGVIASDTVGDCSEGVSATVGEVSGCVGESGVAGSAGVGSTIGLGSSGADSGAGSEGAPTSSGGTVSGVGCGAGDSSGAGSTTGVGSEVGDEGVCGTESTSSTTFCGSGSTGKPLGATGVC